jgi:hypothetical protein
VTARTALRTAVATATTTLLLLFAATAAHAATRDDGEVSGETMSTLTALLVYVGIPAGLFLLIALLVVAPSMARGPRYRPGLGWWAAPVWFNGPENADDAVQAAATTTTTTEGGGASARW